ncbi:MAG: permease [Candidatus Marinimicrobia bacterium]|nr:permease [Candidatus Neomarinimicrobiota bacterium]
MFKLFTLFADLIVYTWLKFPTGSRWAGSLHFFIEDVTKIFFLLVIMIYVIGLLRASINTERIRVFLQGKNRFFGYFLGAGFGAITPFCSCSSIPLFLGFTQARIPIGITMSFLITSPIINEVAIILLGGLLGIKFMIIYVIIGILAGVFGGIFIDVIKAERYLMPLAESVQKPEAGSQNIEKFEAVKLSFKDRHEFAKNELKTIFSRVWKWVFIGVGLGALLHGFVPEEFITNNLGSGQWWSVPGAVLLGIPLYSNVSGMIPIAESLLTKGLPVGTTLAFMMSTVAASFPEFVILKQVMKPRLLLIFFFMLLIMFTFTGLILNLISF